MITRNTSVRSYFRIFWKHIPTGARARLILRAQSDENMQRMIETPKTYQINVYLWMPERSNTFIKRSVRILANGMRESITAITDGLPPMYEPHGLVCNKRHCTQWIRLQLHHCLFKTRARATRWTDILASGPCRRVVWGLGNGGRCRWCGLGLGR